MTFEDRYASAIRSSNLRGNAEAEGAVDVVGAAGIAARQAPLAMALLRLFSGDNHAADAVVELMTSMLVGKAYRTDHEIGRPAASLIARLVLDWYRDSVCKSCGGHGYLLIKGAPSIGDKECPVCRGRGKRSFDELFPRDRVELARWLVSEMERELAKAGPLAMSKLAHSLLF